MRLTSTVRSIFGYLRSFGSSVWRLLCKLGSAVARLWSKPSVNESVNESAKALILFLLLATAHSYIDAPSLGKPLTDFQFALLRAGLLHGALDEPGSQAGSPYLPVVFDISRLHPDKALPTSRKVLDTIVEELDQAGAKAIGVDLEFAENTDKATLDRPEDYEYLARWLNKRTGKRCKVRVGVYGRALKKSQFWLGRTEFRELAAGIALPKEDPNHAFLYSRTCFDRASGLPVKCELGHRAWSEPDQDLIQLPAAMWEIIHDTDALPTLKAKSRESSDGSLVELGGYVIDYSYLKQIQSEIVTPSSLSDVAAIVRHLKNSNKLKNRIVLIGDLGDVGDQFCYSSRLRPLAGVLIHACSVATLNRSLFGEIEGRCSGWVEFGIFAFLLVCSIVGARLVHHYHPTADPADYQSIGILACGTVAIIVYFVFKYWIRDVEQVWPDFFWVSAGLFIHPFLTEPLFRALVALLKMPKTFVVAFAPNHFRGKT